MTQNNLGIALKSQGLAILPKALSHDGTIQLNN
jgi:hypothetical protein